MNGSCSSLGTLGHDLYLLAAKIDGKMALTPRGQQRPHVTSCQLLGWGE